MAPHADHDRFDGYPTPFATPAAQRGDAQRGDTEGEADTHAVVTVTKKAKTRGCIPRVDSLVLTEQRLAHCKRHVRHVPDKLHAHEDEPRSMFKRAIKSIRGALQLSPRI
jgi:hypothetical protein